MNASASLQRLEDEPCEERFHDLEPPPVSTDRKSRAPSDDREDNDAVRSSAPSLHVVPLKRTKEENARLSKLVQEHFDFIWRSLRRLGVPTTDADDCAQQVFWVAARKLAMIQEGSERAFLFSTALRVASDARRSRMRRREVPDDDATMQPTDPSPHPDEMADRKRARALLDVVLSQMDLDLRAVFVLFELEEMQTQEIAEMLQIPSGTVASRLRRAREDFQKLVTRVRLAQQRPVNPGHEGAPHPRAPEPPRAASTRGGKR